MTPQEFNNLFKQCKRNRDKILLKCYQMAHTYSYTFTWTDDMDREDAISKAIINCARLLPQIDKEQNPHSYILGSIHHMFLHYIRHEKFRDKLNHSYAEYLKSQHKLPEIVEE